MFIAASRPAAAQEIETVLVNGKILTIDPQSSIRSALAIREGRIAALGTDADIRRLAGPRTRTIDLQGRTVIHGMIDSHMHATRAALSFSTEVNWIGASSLADGLNRQSADGVITNNIVELFDRLPKPTFDEHVTGTKLFFRELNRLGLTGVVDPGGNN